MSEILVSRTYDKNGNLTEVTRPQTPADVNGPALRVKAQQALATNATYLGHAALPAGAALTTTQLTTIVRTLSAQVDALTKENNALIRLALGLLDDVSGT